MRHIVIRLAVGIIWLVAAAVSCVQGNYLFAGLYAAQTSQVKSRSKAGYN